MKHNVNLYDAVYPPKELWPFSAKVTMISALALTLFFGGMGVATWKLYELKQQYQFELSTKSIKEQAFARMKKEANISIKVDKMKADLASLKAEIKGKKALLQQLEQQTVVSTQGYLGHMVALARQDVKGVWLTNVLLANEGSMVTLAGRTTEPAHIATYLKRLSKEKAFQGVKFIEMRVDEPTPEQVEAGDTAGNFVVSTHEVIEAEKNTPEGLLGLLK